MVRCVIFSYSYILSFCPSHIPRYHNVIQAWNFLICRKWKHCFTFSWWIFNWSWTVHEHMECVNRVKENVPYMNRHRYWNHSISLKFLRIWFEYDQNAEKCMQTEKKLSNPCKMQTKSVQNAHSEIACFDWMYALLHKVNMRIFHMLLDRGVGSGFKLYSIFAFAFAFTFESCTNICECNTQAILAILFVSFIYTEHVYFYTENNPFSCDTYCASQTNLVQLPLLWWNSWTKIMTHSNFIRNAIQFDGLCSTLYMHYVHVYTYIYLSWLWCSVHISLRRISVSFSSALDLCMTSNELV